MKLQSLVAAAVLSVAFGNAMADDFDIGLIGGNPEWTTDKVGASHTAGDFSDTFTFSDYTALASIANGSLTASLPVGRFVFTSATLNGVSLVIDKLGGVSHIDIEEVAVTGPLTLVVNGTVGPKAAGSYGGNFTVTSAVPEPATYGMLVGGMAVLAFAARRRKD